MVKGDTMYPFNGYRNESSLVEFITENYNMTSNKAPIPPVLTYLGLQYIYMKRQYPAWNKKLNELVFTRAGYEHLPIENKLMITLGVIMVVLGLHLIFLVKCCCGGTSSKKHVHKATKDKKEWDQLFSILGLFTTL